ncbi:MULTISPECIES: hypothetical protein [Shewanella]|uniref:hypothetical protein n=1 Tax=Shewanella TaxID=22 RepID=UPI001C656965|nr:MULTISPECIES: hypothetical protein [Shewanella]QYJ76064.1 hypothetical protein K0H79_03505 [Shewanella sp. FJAT-52076]QYK05985.1 hypothetical protein K0H63_03850 [Shewanella zhangzhouensis]
MTKKNPLLRALPCALGLAMAGAVAPLYASDTQALLDDALSAAPPTLRDKVTVMDWQHNVLQQGSSNYTCFPTPPSLQGKAPMCMDGPWMMWADAWSNKKPFQAKSIGISYMLAGDGGASNTDPFAEGKTDDNQWIVEGPHLMIITPDAALLDSLPTDPYEGGPYVMWKGTPYAHIMVPVGPRK